jgi:hypothetical protein
MDDLEEGANFFVCAGFSTVDDIDLDGNIPFALVFVDLELVISTKIFRDVLLIGFCKVGFNADCEDDNDCLSGPWLNELVNPVSVRIIKKTIQRIESIQ